MRSFLHPLILGATRPSGVGLVGTLAVTAIWMLVTMALLDTAALRDHRWVAEPIDDFAWMAGNLVRYQQASPELLQVAVVGTSATREALSDGGALQADLAELLQRPVEVHLLVAGSLYPLEYLVVADHLPSAASGVVVLEVSERQLGLEPRTWHWLARNPRLPLSSPSYRQRVAQAGFRGRLRIPGVYLSEHLDFYAARLGTRVGQRFAPVPYHLHPVDAMPAPQQHEWDRMQANYEHWLRIFDAHSDSVLPIFRQLVDAIRDGSSSQVVFLQAPRNPQFVERVGASSDASRMLNERYHGRIQELAQELQVPYWNLLKDAEVNAEHFRDHAHLRDTDARQRYTRALAEAIASTVRAGDEPQ